MTAVLDTRVPPPVGVRAGAFGNATHLVCRACGEQSPLGPFYACMECFGPLEVGYDFPRVTRAEIEVVRGVALGQGTLDILVEAGWVAPKGRREAPGRPVTWVTTQAFLDHFALASLDEVITGFLQAHLGHVAPEQLRVLNATLSAIRQPALLLPVEATTDPECS